MTDVLSCFYFNKWTNSWTVAVCKNEDLQKHANIIMEDVIQTLVSKSIITCEVATEFLTNHEIVVIPVEHLDEESQLEPGHIIYKIQNRDNQND